MHGLLIADQKREKRLFKTHMMSLPTLFARLDVVMKDLTRGNGAKAHHHPQAFELTGKLGESESTVTGGNEQGAHPERISCRNEFVSHLVVGDKGKHAAENIAYFGRMQPFVLAGDLAVASAYGRQIIGPFQLLAVVYLTVHNDATVPRETAA